MESQKIDPKKAIDKVCKIDCPTHFRKIMQYWAETFPQKILARNEIL